MLPVKDRIRMPSEAKGVKGKTGYMDTSYGSAGRRDVTCCYGSEAKG